METIIMIELYLGAGLAIGLAGMGVALGEAKLGRASLEAAGKNPDLEGFLKSFTILGMALVESAAIYGLVVAILILVLGGVTGMEALGAGLAIGIAGFGVGLGEGNLVAGAIEAVLRNPAKKDAIRTNTILYLALVESAAIYGLVIAILILVL